MAAKIEISAKIIAAVAFVLFLGSPQAKAGTITFDGFTNTIWGDENTGNGLVTQASDGFDFVSSGDHFHFIDMAGFGGPSNGTSSLLEDRDYQITMSQTGGGSFSLSNLQAFGVGSAVDIVVTGSLTGGGTIVTTLSGVPTGVFTDVSFAGFTNLSQVVFDGNTASGFGLENIQVNIAAGVPEPASLTLVLSGIGLIAGLARRRSL